MCGRYQLALPGRTLASLLDARLGAFDAQEPTWNAAPTQVLPILALAEDGARILEPATWGLVPGWSRASGGIRPLINARAETALEKPAFRDAMRTGRVLVPTTGFYEWQGSKASKAPKVPYVIRVRGEAIEPETGTRLGRAAEPGEPAEPFLVAGISTTWIDRDGVPHVSYAVLTTDPNELCAPLHDRMPVILAGDDATSWLQTPEEETEQLLPLLASFPSDLMETWAVEPFVNDVNRNGRELVAPAPPPVVDSLF
ncbi:MAG: uncharacterized protein JWM25_310 [Thermoleophilia bacterium]|nr:uncharacterized protein [Thermoleophilia bacterium]